MRSPIRGAATGPGSVIGWCSTSPSRCWCSVSPTPRSPTPRARPPRPGTGVMSGALLGSHRWTAANRATKRSPLPRAPVSRWAVRSHRRIVTTRRSCAQPRRSRDGSGSTFHPTSPPADSSASPGPPTAGTPDQPDAPDLSTRSLMLDVRERESPAAVGQSAVLGRRHTGHVAGGRRATRHGCDGRRHLGAAFRSARHAAARGNKESGLTVCKSGGENGA